jgi:hypothetical protein
MEKLTRITLQTIIFVTMEERLVSSLSKSDKIHKENKFSEELKTLNSSRNKDLYKPLKVDMSFIFKGNDAMMSSGA